MAIVRDHEDYLGWLKFLTVFDEINSLNAQYNQGGKKTSLSCLTWARPLSLPPARCFREADTLFQVRRAFSGRFEL